MVLILILLFYGMWCRIDWYQSFEEIVNNIVTIYSDLVNLTRSFKGPIVKTHFRASFLQSLPSFFPMIFFPFLFPFAPLFRYTILAPSNFVTCLPLLHRPSPKYRILVDTPERKRTGHFRCLLLDLRTGIKTGLNGARYVHMEWIIVDLDRVQWRELVNVVLDLWVP
jgi:hypothetical protein